MKKRSNVVPALIIGFSLILSVLIHNYINRWEMSGGQAYNKIDGKYYMSFYKYKDTNGKAIFPD